MAEYILQILRSQLMVVLSWGFNSPTSLPYDKVLAFRVDAFKFQGEMKVIYNDGADLFEVHLSNGHIEEDVYADCLVQVIDGLVERTNNYKQSVEEFYHLNS